MSEIFDPEIHATDKQGNPSLNKDGSFRKKRRDAAGRGGGRAAGPRPASPAGRVLADQRAGYHKNVSDFLAIPVTIVSLADPVLGYAAGTIAPMWSEALADLAMEQPRLAAALERVGPVGAVGGVLAVGVLTFVQFGNLLGKVPDHLTTMMGGKTRAEIEQILEQRGVQLRAEAEERARREAEADALEAEMVAAEGAEHSYAA